MNNPCYLFSWLPPPNVWRRDGANPDERKSTDHVEGKSPPVVGQARRLPDEGSARPDHLRGQSAKLEEESVVLFPARPRVDHRSTEDSRAAGSDRRFRHHRSKI